MKTQRRDDMSYETAIKNGLSVVKPERVPEHEAAHQISKKQGGNLLWSVLSWIRQAIQFYLHNIYIITMPEKPRTNIPVIISIITLGFLVLSMWWTYSDRDDRRVKELNAASEANGARKTLETVRDQTIANQAKEIEDLKRTLGLLPKLRGQEDTKK